MRNKLYNKDILEAVTQGEVSGEPARSLDPFRLVKTTLFISLMLLNNSYSQEFLDALNQAVGSFNKATRIIDNYHKSGYESADEAEARYQREIEDHKAVALNKAEIRDQRYWVDKRWICKTNNYTPAKSTSDLVDSDGDGYDDYTEFKHGTSPNNPDIFPAIRDGNNKKVFK